MIEQKYIDDYKRRANDPFFNQNTLNSSNFHTLEILNGKGWVNYRKRNDDCIILSIYADPTAEKKMLKKNSNYDNEIYEQILESAKSLGCNRILFQTHRNPDVWIRRWGFSKLDKFWVLEKKILKIKE